VEEWEGKDDDLDLESLDLVEEREALVSLLLGGLEVVGTLGPYYRRHILVGCSCIDHQIFWGSRILY